MAILGGGITGLAAAESLGRLDDSLETHLFEAGDRLGGVLQTEVAQGFCLEQGPDSILSRDPAGLDLCRRIGFESQLVSTNPSPAGVHVVCRGRLQRVPEGLAIMAPQRAWPIATTPILSWYGKLRLAVECAIPRRRDDGDESLAAFIHRRLGREALERLVQPLAGGIYMGDPERLSIHAAFPQFVAMERQHGSLIRAARRARTKRQPQHDPGGPAYSLFVAPHRGMSQLVDAVAAKLNNCRVHCSQRAQRIGADGGGRWRIEFSDQVTGECSETSWDGVIMALPAHAAASLLQGASGELAAALGEIAYASCVVVNLAYEAGAVSRPLDSFGFVTPHIEKRSTLACTYSHLKYPGRAPKDSALIRAYLGGECFPDVIQWPDERVLDAVRHDLRDLLGIDAPPILSTIKRWRRAMAQYHLGHLDLVRAIESSATRLPGLELAGNYLRGVGIPHCIRSGEQASERLVASLRRQASHSRQHAAHN